MIYNKNLEENLKDYKIRLCKNKDIYGLTFQDIANLINKESGENKSESVYRKWWTAYNEGYQDAERNSLDNDDMKKRELKLRKPNINSSTREILTIKL